MHLLSRVPLKLAPNKLQFVKLAFVKFVLLRSFCEKKEGSILQSRVAELPPMYFGSSLSRVFVDSIQAHKVSLLGSNSDRILSRLVLMAAF